MEEAVVALAVLPDSRTTRFWISGIRESPSRSRFWTAQIVSSRSVRGVNVMEMYPCVGPCTPPPAKECMPGSKPI